MHKQSPFSTMLAVIVFLPFLAIAVIAKVHGYLYFSAVVGAAGLVLAILTLAAVKVADQWERVVVLRLGKFHALRGPGLFFIIPIIDSVPYWIDNRVITVSFKAEKTLTKDTVPVDVDAVLFWKVVDPQKAALEVAQYQTAIGWTAQTALRDVIGKTMLSEMLTGRESIDADLQRIIDKRTESWGIQVLSVEIRDVLIPAGLESAMSMQAQAERERQARVILGDSERQVAEKFEEAARTYVDNPTALHLRAMNMLYEGLKQNATLVIVPSSVLDTMQLGNVAAMAASPTGLNRKNDQKPRSQQGNQAETRASETQRLEETQ